jgi:two-component system sensor histidine kinase VicK
MKNVFSKFFRGTNVLKFETVGTGLGLYITKAFIEASGGKIWVESEEGKGTTMFFTLPKMDKK